MLDFVFDWLIAIVPKWLWWVQTLPLLAFAAYIFWPEHI